MNRPVLAALASLLLLAGCGGDDGDGGRTSGTVVCVGDSLTAGDNCVGAPWPSRLAAMSGRAVVNLGAGGATSRAGAAAVRSALARDPGAVCILYGSNDPGRGIALEDTLANVRAMVSACKARGVPVVLGTPPPTMAPHADRNAHLAEIAAGIRGIADETGSALVDLNAAFAADPATYLNPEDGLHLSDAGGDLVARKFDSKL